MPTPADLAIYEGDDYICQITVMYEDGTTPADLTGYAAKAQIRTAVADSAPTVTAEFNASISGNVITLILPHTQSSQLRGTAFMWDAQITSPSNWITTLLCGAVNVTQDITRDQAAPSRGLPPPAPVVVTLPTPSRPMPGVNPQTPSVRAFLGMIVSGDSGR